LEDLPVAYRLIVLAFVFLSSFAGDRASAQQAIGTISRIQGDASASRGGVTRALGPSAAVFQNESLSTGANARLEITFIDNTRVTLGESVKLRIDRYAINPAAGRKTIRFRVAGAFQFVSGQLSKPSASDVRVVTPAATVGVRGTDFWAGPIDNQALGVLLVEGAISVSNRAGSQVLDQRGQGTNIATARSAPGPVTFWPQDKVDRALAAVAFR
jgi:hypothetical protein